MRTFIIISVFILGININSQNYWVKTNGPAANTVTCLHNGSNGILYCGTYGGGIYYSSNNGDNWNHLDNSPYYIKSIAYTAPSNLVTIKHSYGSAYSPLLERSTDNGITWLPVTNFYYSPDVVAASPNGYFFLASYSAILRSTNYGANWELLYNPSGTNGARQIYIDRTGYIWVCYSSGKLFLSTDNGTTWVQRYNSTNNADIFSIVENKNSNYFIYVAGQGIFKSTNVGLNWTFVSQLYEAGIALAVDSSNTLYTGNSYQVLSSTDEGNHWSNYALEYTNLPMSSIAFSSNNSVFAGYSGSIKGLFRKRSFFNRVFLENGKEITNSVVFSIAKHPNGDIFCGCRQGYIYKSTDNGFNWNLVCSDGGHDVTDIAFDSLGNIYGACYSKLVKSTNGGANWTSISAPFTELGSVQKIAFGQNGLVLVGGTNGFYKSTNNGINWTLLTGPFYLHNIYITKSGTIFLSQLWSLLRSTNNGLTFDSVQNGFITKTCYAVVETPSGLLYCANLNGIYTSSNNGNNWILTSYTYAKSLVVNTAGDVFAAYGTGTGGIYKLQHGSSNWQQINSGLHNTGARCLCLDKYEYLLTGTDGLGVFRSELPTSIKNQSRNVIPNKFSLSQNYPNPFNPSTTIEFDVPEKSHIIFSLYDVTGRLVEVLANELMSPGRYSVSWDGSNYSSGIYFYTLKTESFTQTKRMVLVK